MNYMCEIKLRTIELLEDAILNCKKYSPVWLGVNLRELSELRKEIYYLSCHTTENKEQYKSALIQEYDRYCNFNYKLLTKKKLSNVIFFEVLHKFLNDYDFIKTIDTDKKAYIFTLRTLDYLKLSLKNSGGKMSNYRLRGVNEIAKKFIENNKIQEKDQIF